MAGRGAAIATIKDIALRVGVSIGTVDRVIHNRGRVSRETEERVRRIVRDLDYKPNIFAKHLKLAKTYVFGVLMPKPFQDSGYWAHPVRGIQRAQSEIASHKIKVLTFFYDKFSQASSRRLCRETMKACLDGLIIAPVLSRLFSRFIHELPENLPYVFFDSFIPEVQPLSFIGQDSFQSGRLSARLMRMLIREKGSVAVIRVLPEDFHIDDRVKGFLSYCREWPNIKAKLYEIDGNKRAQSRNRIFRRILEENPDLRGVFVTNASTHHFAEFLQNRRSDRKIYVVGYDLIADNVKCLRRGSIDFLISQQSEKQGYEAVYALYRHVVLGEPVEKKNMMQLDIVTSENIDYYRS